MKQRASATTMELPSSLNKGANSSSSSSSSFSTEFKSSVKNSDVEEDEVDKILSNTDGCIQRSRVGKL